jgi:hypothetical protein
MWSVLSQGENPNLVGDHLIHGGRSSIPVTPGLASQD